MKYLYGYSKENDQVLNANPISSMVYAPSQALKEDHNSHPIINASENQVMKSHIQMFGTIFVYSEN